MAQLVLDVQLIQEILDYLFLLRKRKRKKETERKKKPYILIFTGKCS